MSPAAKQGRQIVEPGAQTLTRGVQCADILRPPPLRNQPCRGRPSTAPRRATHRSPLLIKIAFPGGQVLDGMLRERSGGNGPAVLTAPLNIGVGTK